MTLRTYLASLVIAVSAIPSEASGAGKRKPEPVGEDERRNDPLPYGVPGGKQIG